MPVNPAPAASLSLMLLAAGAGAQPLPMPGTTPNQPPVRQPAQQAPKAAPIPAAPDRPAFGEEAPTFKNLVRLTDPARFHKAGEAYFDHYTRWVVFQAIPAPQDGATPESHYSMYVAPLKRDTNGGIVGIGEPILISPPGSANTCGYFNPKTPYRVMFGSTLIPPKAREGGGFKRDKGSYVWEFPDEMDVVYRSVPEVFDDILPTARQETKPSSDMNHPMPYFQRPGYDAECAFSPDGRFIVYTHVEPGGDNPDIFIFDTVKQEHHPIIQQPGYDGGPFFSPDGRHICYRSDRKGDSLLQVMVAELDMTIPPPIKYDPKDENPPPPPLSTLHGLKEERPVTADGHVNWAPFWSPDGLWLIYASSAIGHDNYEVFIVQAPVGDNAAKKPADLAKRRLTHAIGFDGLPVFNKDGRFMMWTSQRPGDDKGMPIPPTDPRSGVKSSSQVWVAEIIRAIP